MSMSHALALYGTEEAVAPPRILAAGKLTAELEAGNLRYIRWNGEEVLRAVSFIVRDKDWGTYNPAISDLTIEEDDGGFRVSYHAEATEGDTSFAYDAEIIGRPDGTLTFHGRGAAPSGFLTNRTGFVILHPIEGIAGEPVTIEHTGGDTVEGTFPVIIDPVQPMMDLRALTHTTPGGLKVRTLMEGDTYEMEDQRNWTDASYKTYVRPLALPWPYRIEPGETIDQTITVTISGEALELPETGPVRIEPGAEIGTVPPLGLGLRPEDAATARDAVDSLRQLAPAYLILHHDPREGHDRSTLEAMLAVARAVGAEPWLEAVIERVDDAGAAEEVAALGRLSRNLSDPFGTVLVSPAPDLKCTLPGSEWPPAPDAAKLYDATREAFPDARVGGGMFSYFTEFNRKRPPTDHLDLVTFTTSPVVHAGDDRSVMETREAHPAITHSVTEIARGTPWVVGPSAIGVRDNPYGEAAKSNPDNIRQAMNWNDPRQRGLLGAAWNLGYFADFAAGGAAAIALGSCTGPFGVVAAPTRLPQLGMENGDLYPVFHVLRGLSRLRGATLLDLDLPRSGQIAGLSASNDAGTELWLSNVTAEPVDVAIPTGARAAMLDASAIASAKRDAAHMDALTPIGSQTKLAAYAVMRVHVD